MLLAMVLGLERGKAGIKVSDSLDSPEIIFESYVFVGSVRVFVGQAETQEYAGNFERVMHLRDERDGAAFANEHGFFSEAFLESALSNFKDWRVERGDPRFTSAEQVKLEFDGLWQKFANVFFDEHSNFLRILIGNEARGKFRKRF